MVVEKAKEKKNTTIIIIIIIIIILLYYIYTSSPLATTVSQYSQQVPTQYLLPISKRFSIILFRVDGYNST